MAFLDKMKEYLDKGVRVVAVLDEKLRGRFKDYIVG